MCIPCSDSYRQIQTHRLSILIPSRHIHTFRHYTKRIICTSCARFHSYPRARGHFYSQQRTSCRLRLRTVRLDMQRRTRCRSRTASSRPAPRTSCRRCFHRGRAGTMPHTSYSFGRGTYFLRSLPRRSSRNLFRPSTVCWSPRLRMHRRPQLSFRSLFPSPCSRCLPAERV